MSRRGRPLKKIEKVYVDEHVPNKLLDSKEEMITLLDALFKYGHSNLPHNIFPDVSIETVYATMKTKLLELDSFKEKPSVVHWLSCKLYEENFASLALLFIELFEQHPENKKCNFREIYHFLYELMMNQPPLSISHKSAKVLHTLISEILDEVWPETQKEFLDYFGGTYQYSRPIDRRMYSRKSSLERTIE